jgi:hypothetical protein
MSFALWCHLPYFKQTHPALVFFSLLTEGPEGIARKRLKLQKRKKIKAIALQGSDSKWTNSPILSKD